ncbi:MAG: OmpA family protein [Prevotellaceae bacterium]|jgi:outer membrane protein OmpA-like peptidoglycan-associated protein|nr:OmpA family protein [Prevotellaceae bacterium]
MKRSFVLLVVLILFAHILVGQNTKKADKAFNARRYYEAIQEYSLLENKITDPQILNHITFSIAESYRRMNQSEKAEPYYVKAIRGGYLLPDIHFGYGEVLLNLGKYDEAKKQFGLFKITNPDNELINIKIASCDFAKSHRMENPKFTMQPMETLNTRGSEFGIAYFNDNLIYASTGNPNQNDKSIDISPRTGLPYSQFYMSVVLDGIYNKGEPVVELNKVNNRKNGGTFAYDPVNGLGYYTRCTGRARSEQCYIFFAEYRNGRWKEIDNLKIENRSEPIGHPFIMLGSKRIYFVSIMEGGYGKSDIWYADKLSDGTWSRPINLGRKINTPGNEMFPFVAGEYLFFSSDGHPGYGGMDIFASKIDGNIHGPAINLGMPFNSTYDDVNLITKFDFSEGMLVSSRRPDRNDDVFRFEGFPSSLTISGTIYDSATNKPMPEVTIDVKKNGKLVEKIVSDENGKYAFYVDPDSTKYELSASLEHYAPTLRTYHSGKERFATLKGWDLPMQINVAYISGFITGIEKSQDRSTVTQLGPLRGARVEVFENGRAIMLVETDATGHYRFGNIKENTEYKVKVTVGNGNEFFAEEKTLQVGEIPYSIEYCRTNGYDMDIELEKIVKNIRLNNIYYANNKYNLLPESYIELDKLVTLLQKNSTLMIEISSHTDSRGSVKSNQVLSEKRAFSVVDYLIAKGIPSTKLKAIGYGESSLLVKPERSEADYQKNRRTEFTVIGVTGESLYDTRLAITKTSSADNVTSVGLGQNVSQQVQPQTAVVQPQRQRSSIQDMPYTIQLAGMAKPASMSASDFIKIKQLFNLDVYEVYSNGVYRYFAGGFNTVSEAKEMCNKLNDVLGKTGDAKFFVKKK